MNEAVNKIKIAAAWIGGFLQRGLRWFLTVQNYAWSAPVLFFVLILLSAGSEPIRRFELITVDERIRRLAEAQPEVSDKLIFVGIGDQSIESIGRWPWPRERHGTLLKMLSVRPPKAVAYDILFADIGDPVDDAVLSDAAATGLGSRMVFAAHLETAEKGQAEDDLEIEIGRNRTNRDNYGFTFPLEEVQGEPSEAFYELYSAEEPILPFNLLAESGMLGFVDCLPDADGIRRRVPLLVKVGDDFYPSLISHTLLVYWEITTAEMEVVFGDHIIFHAPHGDVEVPINDRGEILLNWRRVESRQQGKEAEGFESMEFVKLTSLLRTAYEEKNPDGSKKAEEEKIQGLYEALARYEDKILIFGQNSTGLTDVAATPLDARTPLSTVHLNAINSILASDFIRVAPFWPVAFGWIVVALAGCRFLRFRSISFAIFLPVAIIIFYVWFCFWIYVHYRLLLPMVWPVLFFGLLHVGSWGSRWLKELNQRMEIRGVFSSYVSGPLLEHLLQHPDKIDLGGDVRPVSVFFSDIRGFTMITETMEPSKLVDQLNEYFTVMVDCVHEHNGTLHKYIGDSVMAVWGDVIEGPEKDSVRQSVASALDMRTRLKTLNRRWKEEGKLEFVTGMGINFGEVLVGHIGAPDRREFSVIGDAVNSASRIEGLTKEFKAELLVGESAEQLLDDSFLRRPIGVIVVQGKTRPIRVFEILARSGEGNKKLKVWAAKFSKAFDLFLERKFGKAEKLFAECRVERPNDFPSKSYTEISRELQASPPSKEWQGLIVMKNK
ncbi:MAG: adenylate cyclase [Verrucomicrobiales bacterium]|jgi:adenylate cyclase